mmetsp:Transcript_2357/g.3753  ORF Transcript_2357/g.3753 Transcript_2357/m.3753 type:complete len:84 (+) Transcript_2357:147-398(+)
MFKEVLQKYGKVDVLVNNAGIARDGLMVRMKPEQWQQVIAQYVISFHVILFVFDNKDILHCSFFCFRSLMSTCPEYFMPAKNF